MAFRLRAPALLRPSAGRVTFRLRARRAAWGSVSVSPSPGTFTLWRERGGRRSFGEGPDWVPNLPPLLRPLLAVIVVRRVTSTDVDLTDTLPVGLSRTVGGADAGTRVPVSPVAGGSTLTCNFGRLIAGSSRAITLTATTTTTHCGIIGNTAVVTLAVGENTANNPSGRAHTTVTCPGGIFSRTSIDTARPDVND